MLAEWRWRGCQPITFAFTPATSSLFPPFVARRRESGVSYADLESDKLGSAILMGVSPRSDGDDEHWGDHRDEEDERVAETYRRVSERGWMRGEDG